MKIIGILLLLIGVGALSIYGMSVTSDLMQSGDELIEDTDPMYQSFTTSKDISVSSWSLAAYAPYLLGLALLISMLGVLVIQVT